MTTFKPIYNANKDTRPSGVTIGISLITVETYTIIQDDRAVELPVDDEIVYLTVPREIVYLPCGGASYDIIADLLEQEAKDFLYIFNDFLSFTRGFRVPLILYIGFNSDNNIIWEYWDSSLGNSWKNVSSWFDKNKANKVSEVFPGFILWWKNWEDSAKLALYWYLEANASSLLEQQIILTQIALELIAYKEGHTTGYASEKLRALITKYNIPVKIPFDKPSKKSSTLASAFISESPSLISNLVKLKKKLEEEIAEKIEKAIQENKIKKQKELENIKVDAPYVFTKIRNNIMHSKKDIEDSEKFLSEAADLGIWYL